MKHPPVVNAQVITSGTGIIPAGAKEIGFTCLSGTVQITYGSNTITLDASGATASSAINFSEDVGARYNAFSYDATSGTFQYGDRR